MHRVERGGSHAHREYAVVSQMIKEHRVPRLHRPVGEQHIDFTRGIKVMCARIDDGRKDVFPIGPDKTIGRVKDGEQVHITWTGVVRGRSSCWATEPKRITTSKMSAYRLMSRFTVSLTRAAVASSSQA